MNILQIISSINPEYGGVAEGLKLGALELRKLGHETEVVTLDEPGADFLAEYPFRVHPLAPWFRRYGYTPELADWVARNAHRFDAAIVHGLWHHASVGAWQGLRRAGLPYVVFTHGMMDPWFKERYPLKHLAKQAFWWLWQGKVLRDAQFVLFTCQEEARMAEGAFIGPAYRPRVVAFGTSEPPSQSGDERSAFRSLVPALGERPYFLFLSRIHPKKGCDLLIEAFAEVSNVCPDIDLVIAGPDQVGWKEQLEAQAREAGISDRIHWPGMVSGPAKFAAYRGAEAFILPSHQENFGIVVAEALACGCPVLISNKVNIWREIEAAGAGFVEEDTASGAADLFRRFLALPEDARAAMRDAGVELHRSHFTSRAAARDLEIILQEISGHRAERKTIAPVEA